MSGNEGPETCLHCALGAIAIRWPENHVGYSIGRAISDVTTVLSEMIASQPDDATRDKMLAAVLERLPRLVSSNVEVFKAQRAYESDKEVFYRS